MSEPTDYETNSKMLEFARNSIPDDFDITTIKFYCALVGALAVTSTTKDFASACEIAVRYIIGDQK